MVIAVFIIDPRSNADHDYSLFASLLPHSVYLAGGHGDTILLLHGFSADKDNWTRFAKYLTASYRVVAPDLPGFGDSDKHEDAMYDIGSQVERLAELAKALDLESFHLVGNSMGGHIAAVYAHRYPQQVISLGLFNSSGVTEPQMSEAHQALANGKNLLLVDDVADFARVLAFVFVEQPEIRNALPGPEISGEP